MHIGFSKNIHLQCRRYMLVVKNGGLNVINVLPTRGMCQLSPGFGIQYLIANYYDTMFL